ncbi:MAG: radical SAM protein [Candidatus Altiarchaeota archaeon]
MTLDLEKICIDPKTGAGRLCMPKKIIDHITENACSTLRIVINKECTLRCKWCYKEGIDHEKNTSQLSTNTYVKAIRVAHDTGFTKVNFTGGEPLLYPDLAKIAHEVEQLGMKSYVTTNATVMTGIDWNTWKKLKSHEFHVSVNTIDAQEFQDICGEDMVANVLQAVAYLLDSKIPVKLNTVVSSEDDWSRVAKVIDYAAEKKLIVKLLGVHDVNTFKSMSQREVAEMIVKNGAKHVRTSEGRENNYGYDQYTLNGALVHVLNMIYGGGCCDRYKTGQCGEGIRYPRLVYNGEIKPCLHVTTAIITDKSTKKEIREKLTETQKYVQTISRSPYYLDTYPWNPEK